MSLQIIIVGLSVTLWDSWATQHCDELDRVNISRRRQILVHIRIEVRIAAVGEMKLWEASQ